MNNNLETHTINDAIQTITNLKDKGLLDEINKWSKLLKGAKKNTILNQGYLHDTAVRVKNISSQINEVVHATGIIKCLPHILNENETIETTSLASGAKGDGFDLVTDKRIAEFKFSVWKGSDGSRKRQVFADFARLYMDNKNNEKKKELYVLSYDLVDKFFHSKKAKWKNVLSKSGNLLRKFENFLRDNNIEGESLYDVFSNSGVELKDIDNLLQQ